MLLGLMRMPVEQKIEMPGVFHVAQQAFIISVRPGEVYAFQFQIAERLVQACANLIHRLAELALVPVTVAEDDSPYSAL